ncbi:MAG: hypothetical protein KDB80_09370, partial [Planctomycetes bacterium]|nr:hypothetical protein [Planctomycetota bacterium]
MTLILHRLAAASLTALTFAACSVPESNRPTDAEPIDAETGAADLSQQDPQDPIHAARTRLLVENMIENAERMRRNGQLENARLELLNAQSLDENNERVRGLLRAVHDELGLPAPSDEFAANQESLYRIHQARRRSELSALLDEAMAARDQQDYDRALDILRRAEMNIEIGADIDWGDLEDRLHSMTAAVTAERDDAVVRESEAVMEEIEAKKRELAERELARRTQRRNEMLSQATRAFERQKFSLAQDLAFQAMTIDPNSQIARELHEASIKAMRESRQDRYYRDMAIAVRKKLEADLEVRITQTDLLTVDPEIAARAKARKRGSGTVVEQDADDVALRQKIGSETLEGISFTADDGTYDEVKARIQTITNIPIIITPEAREVLDSEGLAVVMDIVAPITVQNLLDHMVGKSEQLAWTVANGVVELTTKAAAGGSNTQVLHDVRDLVYPRTTFLPPQILNIPTADDSFEVPRTGGVGEDPTFFIEMDPLVQAIKDATNPTYWDAEGGGTIDQTETGYLLVVANAEMQEAVRGTLDDLREFATTVVKIDTKFLTVTRNFLQQVGVDFRGLGGSGAKGTVATLDDVTNGLDDNASQGFNNAGTSDPAANPASGAFFNDGQDGDYRGLTENAFQNPLGNALTPNGGITAAIVYLDDLQLQALIRAVEKQEDVEEMNAQTVTIQNNERGYVAVINQTSYIRDFDVEVAQAAFIADPKVDVIQDGVVLDVKPTINHDRRDITLDMNPTVAELERPIPTFSTSLSGTTQPVTLQLPQLTVHSFATTATVPDGGSLLIGGLRRSMNVERRAEVPILGKIP